MALPVPTRRIAFLIEYDGSFYSGWQRQLNAPSIQEIIENAFQKMFNRYVGVVSAGRTDAGVHAVGQVAHADLPAAVEIPGENLRMALNTLLPEEIRILSIVDVSDDFHARFSAIQRTYFYYISLHHTVFLRHYTWPIRYAIDEQKLVEAATIFEGTHDFTTFSKFNEDTDTYVCKVFECKWEQLHPKLWRLRISANRFVYGMVRAVVGAMIDIARGKRTITEVSSALQQKDRSLSSPLAPAHGLFLTRVLYDPDPFGEFYEKNRLSEFPFVVF